MAVNHIRSQDYLAHIDGLRAIAVLAIVLFHFDVHWLSGGYVGVDIFFVISGFLITSHIQGALQQGSFSFAGFYGRRIRRLLPALLVTLAGCLVAGYVLFPAVHFERQGLHSLQALLSIANIGFWLESGYFDGSALLKPLLHTWSLSVEEQFYLVWPAILLLLGLHRLKWLAILLLGCISLILAEYWFSRDPAAVFFLMPFRVAEFCLGALLYWIGSPARRWMLNELLVVLGLALIIIPVLTYDETTRFPGITALIPCAGTALLIYAGAHARLGRLLQNPVLRFIGLISYSLYLVHWPLVVFYKYAKFPSLRPFEQVLLLLVAVLVAALMYRFVETPFRRRTGSATYAVPTRYFAPGILLCVLLLGAISWHIYSHEGWAWRHPASQWTQEQIEKGKGRRYVLLNRLCEERGWDNCHQPSGDKRRNVLILGDSHAPDALNMFSLAFPDYHYVMKSLPGGCPPIIDADTGIMSPAMPDREACIAFNREILDTDVLKDYDTVIISVFFQWYRAEHLLNAVEQIRDRSDAAIIVLGNYIALHRDMADLYNQQIDPRVQTEFVESFARFEEELRQQAQDRYLFVSKRDLFCASEHLTDCKLFFDDAPFAYDMHHLSFEATQYAAQQLNRQFRNLEVLRQPR